MCRLQIIHLHQFLKRHLSEFHWCTLRLAEGPPFCTWRTVRKRGCKGKPLLRPKEYMRSMSTDSGPFSGKRNLRRIFGYGWIWDMDGGCGWIPMDWLYRIFLDSQSPRARSWKVRRSKRETICKSELHCSRSLSKLKESFSCCAKNPLPKIGYTTWRQNHQVAILK